MYAHMFDNVFAAGKPWLFGSLFVPGGSKSLGLEEFALRPGTQAPLVVGPGPASPLARHDCFCGGPLLG
jgi:hypothetical protein